MNKHKWYPVLLVSVSLLLAREANDTVILRVGLEAVVHEQAV